MSDAIPYVLTRSWQCISPGVEARVMSWGDQRVNPDGRPIICDGLIPPEVQATQRFVYGAMIEVRAAVPTGTAPKGER